MVKVASFERVTKASDGVGQNGFLFSRYEGAPDSQFMENGLFYLRRTSPLGVVRGLDGSVWLPRL